MIIPIFTKICNTHHSELMQYLPSFLSGDAKATKRRVFEEIYRKLNDNLLFVKELMNNSNKYLAYDKRIEEDFVKRQEDQDKRIKVIKDGEKSQSEQTKLNEMKMREELERIAEENAEKVAKIAQDWILEVRSKGRSGNRNRKEYDSDFVAEEELSEYDEGDVAADRGGDDPDDENYNELFDLQNEKSQDNNAGKDPEQIGSQKRKEIRKRQAHKDRVEEKKSRKEERKLKKEMKLKRRAMKLGQIESEEIALKEEENGIGNDEIAIKVEDNQIYSDESYISNERVSEEQKISTAHLEQNLIKEEETFMPSKKRLV